MPGVHAATAYVDIQGDFSSLNKQIAAHLGPLSGKFGAFGKAATVGLAGIGAAGIGAATGLAKIGAAFDGAYDTIRVSTGKTGKQLEGLQSTFKNVVKTVPADFGSASTAIAKLNQRLDITGKPLEGLAKRFLELSRITGTDLSGNIDTVTRLFGNWSIKTRDQAGAMDKLFRASQRTGVPVNELGQMMVKYGAPLRQLGFSFDEAAAMVGKFEKEGVNTQLVMGSMRVALGKLAKSGEEPIQTFKRVVSEISNAGNAGKANALALELFGARAGPDMAAAIREGRFELGALTGQIAGGHDTIMQASADTQDFGEKWQVIKNRILVGLEPLATSIFNAIGAAMDQIGPVTTTVAETFDRLKAAFAGAGEGSGRMGEAIVTLQGGVETFRGIFTGIVDVVQAAWARFGDAFIDYARRIIGPLMDSVQAIMQQLQGLIDFVAGVFTGDWSRAWDGIKNIAAGSWNRMVALIEIAWETIKAAVRLALIGLGAILTGEWDAIKTAATGAWSAVKGAIVDPVGDAVSAVKRALGSDGLAGWLEGKWTSITSAIGTFAGNAKDAITGAFKGAANVVIGFINAIISAINAIPGVPEINPIAKLAQGGTLGGAGKGTSAFNTDVFFARGGKVTAPMAIVGEEAPRHPEFVIPTNPAYRGRALGLYAQLSKDLGIPGFKRGGILGAVGAVGDLASSAFDFVKGGVSGILGKLPGAGDLPAWLKGLGTYLLGHVTGWIKHKITSLFSGGGGVDAGALGGELGLIRMIRTMDAINAKGYPYVYGGGHGSFNGPYDCSGLVSAILHAGGFLGSPITTDGLKVFGEGGDGRYITIGVRGSTGRSAHTMMRIGDRYLESGSGHGARWVSGWSGGFPIHRHPPGMAQGGIIDTELFRKLIGDGLLGWGLAQGGILGPYVGSYRTGGVVPRDGIAQVHAGETITPADRVPEVRVFIGDQELRGIIRVEVAETDREKGAAFRAGVLP